MPSNPDNQTTRSRRKPRPPRGGPIRRTFRFCWRFARTFTLVLLLGIVALGVQLHNVGLPERVKGMMIEALRRQGWEMEYARLRFRWMKGIVGEDLHFRPVDGQPGPQLFVEEVDFRLRRDDLLHLAFTPESLALRNGRCLWTVRATNEPTRTLALERVRGLVRYQEPGRLDLDAFTARFHGLDLRVEGHLTNMTRILEMEWPARRPEPGQPPRKASVERFLHSFARELDRTRVGEGSSLSLKLQGTGGLTNSLQAEMEFLLPSVESHWLAATNATVWWRLSPPATNDGPFQVAWHVEGRACLTPWGQAELLSLQGVLGQRLGETLPSSGQLTLRAIAPGVGGVRAAQVDLAGTFLKRGEGTHPYSTEFRIETEGLELRGWKSRRDRVQGTIDLSPVHLTPLAGHLALSTQEAETGRGGASNLTVRVEFQSPITNSWWAPRIPGGPEWRLRDRWWEDLALATLHGEVDTTGFTTGPLAIPAAHVEARWAMPDLELTRLTARLNRGEVAATVSLNLTNRHAMASVTNTSDIHLLNPLFKTNTQAWLAKYGWKEPPWVRADAEITLPPWSHFLSRLEATNTAALPPIPWKEESLPSFRLHGRMRVGEGDYMGAQFSSAELSFHGSNQVWFLPDIIAHRPEGEVELQHLSNDATGDYWFHIRSGIDPAAIRPLLSPAAQEGLNLFGFGQVPFVEGDVWGRWRVPSRLGVSATLRATNLSFRGETASRLGVASLRYTNRMFIAGPLELVRPEGRATVAEAWFDLDEQKLRLTNVLSAVELGPVCRAIGPKVAETMQDYEFAIPPHVRMDGVVDTLKRRNENDLHFDVEAQQFHWKIFNLTGVSTHLDWVNDRLDLLGFKSDFYQGGAIGDAHFDFARDRGTDFRFNLNARGVALSDLMADVSTRSNRLDGLMSCDLVITNANTRDKFTWNGYGRGELTNGLIWDIPVFAVISPALNAVIPGLGNSRARQATGTFVITNGVIRTEDLDIRATGMRMKGGGTVDFDKRVNARLEAELLRDMPGLGFLISKVLYPITKLFEFKITGTLDKPKTDQLYMVPRILLAPFHPIRTLKEILPGDSKTEPRKPEPEKP